MKNTKANAKKHLLKNGRMMFPMSDYNANDVISLMYSYAEQLNKPAVINLVCPFCDGSPVEKVSGENHCPYCDKYW